MRCIRVPGSVPRPTETSLFEAVAICASSLWVQKLHSVITFSLLKGLVAGIATGYVSQRVHSMLLGIIAGIGIAAGLSLLVILRAGMALFWDILLPGMLLGAIVGFATQRFGPARESAVAVQ